MPGHDRSDAEIVGASTNDPEQFGEIFRRHHTSVFRFVVRRIGTNDATDVTADVFDRAFAIRHRYDTTRVHSLPWLYGIATNIVGDRLRQSARRKRIDSRQPRYITMDETVDADDRAVAAQIDERLNRALAQLSRKDRDTLLLYALEGFTYSEISVALEIPVGTVGSRISRARAKILEGIPDLEQIISAKEPNGEGKTIDD